MFLLSMLLLLSGARALQIRAECHAFHCSQAVRIAISRQEVHNVSDVAFHCTVLGTSSSHGCALNYVGYTGQDIIWLLSVTSLQDCRLISGLTLQAVYRQEHGVSRDEIQLIVVDSNITGRCGLVPEWIRDRIPFLTSLQLMQAKTELRAREMHVREVLAVRESLLCPSHVVKELQAHIWASTLKAHGPLVQEIHAVAQQLQTVPARKVNMLLLAAANRYLTLRAATLSVVMRLACLGFPIDYSADVAGSLLLPFSEYSADKLSQSLLGIIIGLVTGLAATDGQPEDEVSKTLFGVGLADLESNVRERGALCLLHTVQTLHGYTYLDPDLSGFMHCILDTGFAPSVTIVPTKRGFNIARAIAATQKRRVSAHLSPEELRAQNGSAPAQPRTHTRMPSMRSLWKLIAIALLVVALLLLARVCYRYCGIIFYLLRRPNSVKRPTTRSNTRQVYTDLAEIL